MKISKASLWLILGTILFLYRAEAVENGTNNSFNTTTPTGSDIPNWNTGWTQPSGQTGVTGWNYVGIVAGGGGAASGVYLGNSWVITAGHVGAGAFTLGGTTYPVVAGSAQTISNANGTADICLFQINPAPNLPALSIATSPPTRLSSIQSGSQVAMIGYGDGGSITHETWGLNTVTDINQLIQVDSFESTDFVTAYGTTTRGGNSATNNYFVVLGDSGGGDFIFNSSNSTWQLAGINEATGNNNPPDSFFVELSAYAPQINAIVATGVPALPRWGFVVLLAVLLAVGVYFHPRKSA